MQSIRLTPALLLLLCACSGAPDPEEAAAAPSLRDSLIFHASFEDGMDAAHARGDRRIYSAPDYKSLDQRSPGYWGEDIEIAYDSGRVGHALRFNKKNVKALFYSADGNFAFSPDGWTGTISFWLSLDPATDLEPGFCDPIQVTDSAYNDSAIWVDFTRDNPRQFRLGVFGELTEWNPEKLGPDDYPVFNERLVVVDQPPFAGGEWTHVLITHNALGGGSGKGRLYLNGELQGETSMVAEGFDWDPANAAIRLGVNYVGLMDEVAVFDRVLDEAEIQQVFNLEAGVSVLR